MTAIVFELASVMPALAVVGGMPGGPGEASAVMVLTDNGGVCSGVVVAADAVLTAAHCVPSGRQVRVHYRELGQPVLLEPAQVARHPEFRPNAVAERVRSIDLALVRLSRPLPPRFMPATLSTAPAEAVATVAGFGLAVEGDPSGMGQWRSVALNVTKPHGESRILLWLQGAPGTGACQGDSGGPIIGQQGDVLAITSWTTGTPPRRCGVLTQGVLLAAQRAWIERTLAQWGLAGRWR